MLSDKSKLNMDFNEFDTVLNEVPYDVFYQTINSDYLNASGFQFTLTKPGPNALLSTDVWVEYVVPLFEGGEADSYVLSDTYEDLGEAFPIPAAQSFWRLAFRSGYIHARAIRNLEVQINDLTTRCYPYSFYEELARIYVSNDQSKHEFSTSGGCFDTGNHSLFTQHVIYENQDADTNQLSDNYTGTVVGDYNGGTNSRLNVYLIPTWFPDGDFTDDTQDMKCNMRTEFPLVYHHYNQGFGDRFTMMAERMRVDSKIWPGEDLPLAELDYGERYQGLDPAVEPHWYFRMQERLPFPLFKMFNNDDKRGIIPNISRMIIKAQFLDDILSKLMVCDDPAIDCLLKYETLTGFNCKMYVKWYMPKSYDYTFPDEVFIKFPKIQTWSKNFNQATAMNADTTLIYVDTAIEYHDITLQGLPDVLMIYCKYNANELTIDTPEEYHLELVDIQLDLGSSGGRINGLNSPVLYNMWKNYLKHEDNKIMGYTEWQKTNFVALLRPMDIGIRKPDEANNPISIGIRCTARNWWNIPDVGYMAEAKPLGGEDGAGTDMTFYVVSIYDRNKIVISPDHMYELLGPLAYKQH